MTVPVRHVCSQVVNGEAMHFFSENGLLFGMQADICNEDAMERAPFYSPYSQAEVELVNRITPPIVEDEWQIQELIEAVSQAETYPEMIHCWEKLVEAADHLTCITRDIQEYVVQKLCRALECNKHTQVTVPFEVPVGDRHVRVEGVRNEGCGYNYKIIITERVPLTGPIPKE